MSQFTPWFREEGVPQSLGERYERYLAPVLFEPWAADLVARAAPQPDERILDVACGTGVVTREARRVAGAAAAVTGVDLNPGMLTRARARDTEGAISWVEGSVQSLPFPDASFTLVVCQQGLQYFPDRASALREMRRVLAPGGRLRISVWNAINHNPIFQALGRAWARYVEPGAETLPPYTLGEGEGLLDEVKAAGFRDALSAVTTITLRYASLEEFPESYIRGTLLFETWSQLPEETRAALTSDVHSALAPYVEPGREPGQLVFPSETRYLIGRA